MLITVSAPGLGGPLTWVGLAGWLAAAGAGEQMKFASGRGRLFGRGGCLGHCASIHCTRGSVPDGETGSKKKRT